MTLPGGGRILIAGGGIAGLTAALAFSQQGFETVVFERAASFEEIGAGLQLSPNATLLLRRLGVLDALQQVAVAPDAVTLRSAATLRVLARVPLGRSAEERWGAPYLTVHRADLHAVLLDAARADPRISLRAGCGVRDFAVAPGGGASLTLEDSHGERREPGMLVVGADGVWSTLRGLAGDGGRSRFIGRLAWRRTIDAQGDDARALLSACPEPGVNAFLHPGFHLVAYPIRGGAQINLVAFTPSRVDLASSWTSSMDDRPLRQALAGTSPMLARLAGPARPWTAWPIHVADLDGPWIDPAGMALIGDAAHAMTPFAAQGAAMAIEDAASLARAVATVTELPEALQSWSVHRRRRVLKVARRGAFNQFTWHASGPIRLARNLMLSAIPSERLAGQFDWLYGHDAVRD